MNLKCTWIIKSCTGHEASTLCLQLILSRVAISASPHVRPIALISLSTEELSLLLMLKIITLRYSLWKALPLYLIKFSNHVKPLVTRRKLKITRNLVNLIFLGLFLSTIMFHFKKFQKYTLTLTFVHLPACQKLKI